ncbi:MAG TPA: AAA family ATPase, partial [Candidatus Dormibacteraeota bacterium]|nr:AAA family ATPase [Candidatus Dormibacteraeota bacterium]
MGSPCSQTPLSFAPLAALVYNVGRQQPAAVEMQLLERDKQLDDLSAWLDSAAEQAGLIALVEGEAGIGKSALLQEFAQRQRRVARVLWGGCDALFTPRPLSPLHDIA